MDETSDKPDDQVAIEPVKISQEQLKEIIERHRLYLESDGVEGERADLRGANLQGQDLRNVDLRAANLEEADLRKANLQEINLERANLEKANLSSASLESANLQGASLVACNLREAILMSANLQGANLKDADLRGAALMKANLRTAVLQGAKLQGAKLQATNLQEANLRNTSLEKGEIIEGKPLPPADITDAILKNADLSDAKLSEVTGLLSEKLAGTNLSNAKIPVDIAKFDGLAHVEELSKHARNNFLGVIGGCVFSWLTIAMTTDLALVTGSSATPLPIIQTPVPINGFYMAAPLILLALYFYLHLYLQRMWEGLASLPAVFPDGRTLDQTVYPWLLTGLARPHVPLLRENRPSLSKLQVGFSIVTAWALVPATILLFWFRYLPRQESIGTIFLCIIVLVATWSSIGFYRRARATLRGDDIAIVTKYPAAELLATAVTALIVGGTSHLAIDGPRRFDLFGYGLYAEVRDTDISTKPANWTGLPSPSRLESQSTSTANEKSRAAWAQVKGARLAGANLRHANALGAFLAKADLQGANLKGAMLWHANLWSAQLGNANLTNAYLWSASLQEANLSTATLTGAKLGQANLSGAYLKGVIDLTQEQLDSACGDQNTVLPEGLMIKPCKNK